MSWKEFEELNERLVSHAYPTMGCPNDCGCSDHDRDCPQLYSMDDVKASAEATLSAEAEEEFKIFLKSKHDPSREFCKTAGEYAATPTGGYCLLDGPDGENLTLPNGHVVQVRPPGHAMAAPRIVWAVVELLKTEGAKSYSDFGAGLGQYAAEVVPKLAPDFQYNAYDGAGNIEEYTKSFVRFADLSAPLNLPKTDWVMSLEVGEHVPARFEGLFLRNLHRHNCRGVVLSWAIMVQSGGLHHINLHTNDYVVQLFTQLGYERDVIWEQHFRNETDNAGWFTKSSFVFRRKVPVC